MKIRVDDQLCEANAICMQNCPEIFRVEDDDTLTIVNADVPDGLLANVRIAVDRCPRQALSLE